jgi:phosphatidylglycerophosphatase A
LHGEGEVSPGKGSSLERLYLLSKAHGSGSRIALVLSTWFGAGLVPHAPGTFGSAAALPPALLLANAGLPFKILGLAILAGLAVWACGLHSKLDGNPDPPQAVMDEVAGMAFSLCFIPCTWFNAIAGFCLFRFFDILKPFPIKRTERLKGGLGIVADDLAAGLYTMLALMLTERIGG